MSVVKELNLRSLQGTKADLMLSTMSNDFETLPKRLEDSGLFERIFMFDEKEDVTSDAVMKHHKNTGNICVNMFHRIRYTSLLGRLQEASMPTDLSQYKDIYVFCDSDPIGYYLNYRRLPYHAIEDGLNSGLLDDQAFLSNKNAFSLKKFLARTGLIFIECGYSRYCIDYEVNDISANHSVPPNVIEVPHSGLLERLSDEDHALIAGIFIRDWDRIIQITGSPGTGIHDENRRPVAMILTEPLCDLQVRRRMFSDIIDMYAGEYTLIIKPHPRDQLDYEREFPDVFVIKDRFPMEVLNDMRDFGIDKLISVITQTDDIRFAKSIDYLGLDFLDRYEDPRIHRRLDTLQIGQVTRPDKD